MTRTFDDETYRLNPSESVLSRYRNLISAILTLAVIALVFFAAGPFHRQPGAKFRNDLATITHQDLAHFDPNGDLTRFTRQDLEFIIHTLGPKSVPPSPPTLPASSPTTTTDSKLPVTTPPAQSSSSTTTTTSPPTTPQAVPIPPLYHGHEIIVTLTTIPDRMPYLNATLLSLVSQTIPPTEIVLNIPYISRRFFNPDGSPVVYDLPVEFIQYINLLGRLDEESVRKDTIFPFELPVLSRIPRITIHRCDDDGPATKLLPTLAREFAIGRMDSILIIADDDVIYPPNWVESLVGYYLSNPHLHYTALGARGYCAPPTNVWEWRVISQIAVSGTQLSTITDNLNQPYRVDPITDSLEPHFGSPLEEDNRTQITPNSHRFIWRNQNYTVVEMTGGRPVRSNDSSFPNITTTVKLNPDWDFNYLFDQSHPSYKPNQWHKHRSDDVRGTLEDARTFVENELGFDHLYDPIQEFPFNTILPHIPHQKRSMSHTPVDIITGNNGFLLRPYYFMRYTPFIGNLTRFEPQVLTSVSLQQHLNKVNLFQYTTNNRYYSKFKPFLKAEFTKAQEIIDDKIQYLQEMKSRLTTNQSNDKAENAPAKTTTGRAKTDAVLVDPRLEPHVPMDAFWVEHGELSQLQQYFYEMLDQGDEIDKVLSYQEELALKTKFDDALSLSKGSNLGQAMAPRPPDPNAPLPTNHTHPELDAMELSTSMYHMEHRVLHVKLNAIDDLLSKFTNVASLYAQDLPLQYEVLSSQRTNIVPFGTAMPRNVTRFETDLRASLWPKKVIPPPTHPSDPQPITNPLHPNPPDLTPYNGSPMLDFFTSSITSTPHTSPFDFNADTKGALVLGVDQTKPLPESVYYMDDIWFNGILAANDVSRVVTSLTIDPVHRPKMQKDTTTLEQVPIGRSFHNNVLLKAFEQHWTNCPYIMANITIPDFYLRYFTLSSTNIEDRQKEAIEMLNKRRKTSKNPSGRRDKSSQASDSVDQNGSDNTAPDSQSPTSSKRSTVPPKWSPPVDDYRNSLSNPWAEWGVPDLETNVSTQFYYFHRPLGVPSLISAANRQPSAESKLSTGTDDESSHDRRILNQQKQQTEQHQEQHDFVVKGGDVAKHKADYSNPTAKVDPNNLSDFFQKFKEDKMGDKADKADYNNADTKGDSSQDKSKEAKKTGKHADSL